MNNNILGDKPKHNFDDSLANAVNKIFANLGDEEYEKEVEKSGVIKFLPGFGIDVFVPNEREKSLNQWKEYFKQESQGIVFANMSDYYKILKQIFNNLKKDDSGKVKSSMGMLRSFIKDSNALLSSTRLSIADNSRGSMNESMRIDICHEEGTRVRTISDTTYHYSLLKSRNIEDFLKNSEGEKFFQSLFQTKDGGKTIRAVLDLFGAPNIEIILTKPIQAINTFKYYGVGFFYNQELQIRCDVSINSEYGCCRGIKMGKYSKPVEVLK